MAHWTDHFVGKEYVIDEYDCVHLCVEVQQKQFGNTFEIDIVRERKLMDQTEQIHSHLDEYVYSIEEDEVEEGDLVLMKVKHQPEK